MNAVPDFITTSENRWAANAESYDARLARAESHIKAEVLDHIKAGRDALLPIGKHSWPISTFLGDSTGLARTILFGACHLALKGAPDGTVVEAIKQLVNVVAGEYAADRAPDLVGEDE